MYIGSLPCTLLFADLLSLHIVTFLVYFSLVDPSMACVLPIRKRGQKEAYTWHLNLKNQIFHIISKRYW